MRYSELVKPTGGSRSVRATFWICSSTALASCLSPSVSLWLFLTFFYMDHVPDSDFRLSQFVTQIKSEDDEGSSYNMKKIRRRPSIESTSTCLSNITNSAHKNMNFFWLTHESTLIGLTPFSSYTLFTQPLYEQHLCVLIFLFSVLPRKWVDSLFSLQPCGRFLLVYVSSPTPHPPNSNKTTMPTSAPMSKTSLEALLIRNLNKPLSQFLQLSVSSSMTALSR